MEFPSNSRRKTVCDQKLSATTLRPPTCPAAVCGRPSSAWPGRGIEPATHAGTPAGCVAGSDGWARPPGEVAGSPPEWRWSTGEERCAGASGPAPEMTQLLWCPLVEERRGAGWGEDVVLLGVWFSWSLASLWVHVYLILFFILLLFSTRHVHPVRLSIPGPSTCAVTVFISVLHFVVAFKAYASSQMLNTCAK